MKNINISDRITMTKAGIRMKQPVNGTTNSTGFKMKPLENGIMKTGNLDLLRSFDFAG